MQTQILQIGEQDVDIEMHVVKNKYGVYFVSFHMFDQNSKGVRVLNEKTNVIPFDSKEEIHDKYSKKMVGQTINI
jgi:hypothetical protein